MGFPTTLPVSRIPDPMLAPPLRWGILGTGWIADQFCRAVAPQTRQNLAAVGSRSLGTARAFAADHGIPRAHGRYEDLLADPGLDVIYVASPHNFHHAHVRMALEAGKHVLVEKPIALNHAQAAEMAALARARGLFLAEALWTFFLPKFDVIDQLIADGVLGEIRAIYSDYGEYLPPDHRLFDPKLAGGPLLDLGTYPVALITRLMGVPRQVVGLGQAAPLGVNGQLAVVMQNARGNLATMGTTPYGFSPVQAAVIGSTATLRFGGPMPLPGPFELWSQEASTVARHEEPVGRHFDGLHFEAAEVARCIAAGLTETRCRPLAESLATMQSLDAIRRSIGIGFEAAGLHEEQS